jgi:hypothetical protein
MHIKLQMEDMKGRNFFGDMAKMGGQQKMEIKEMKCEGREMDSSRSKQGPVSGSC